jgi:DNA-binding helix-hairpin-helix protein with protein kinase domain
MSQRFHGRDSGKHYLIEKELGSGGQGRVYLVKDAVGSGHYAAKWYKPAKDADGQISQIEDLVRRGAPKVNDPGILFIWPIECLAFQGSEGFGYLMPLIDAGRFHSLNRICHGRVKQPKPPALCRIGQRVAAALDTLHAAGLAYCDINLGNIMLDPATGEIAVCDNDNVVVNNADTPVKGVWEFMAPEVALGQARPNAESDLYSVAVLLYYLWMWEHPMEGRETLKLYSWDIPAKKKYFAESPLFVFHPTNQANTAENVPDLRLHVERWTRLCPPRLKKMFTETFIEAVHQPARRKRLTDWQRLFLELEANAPTCACGAANLWDGATKPLKCWKCQKEIPLGLALRVKQGHSGDSVLLAYPGAELRRHHLDVTRFDGAPRQALGRVEPHPQQPGHLILRNLSDKPWGYAAGGGLLPLEPQRARALMPGVELTAGAKTIQVQAA